MQTRPAGGSTSPGAQAQITSAPMFLAYSLTGWRRIQSKASFVTRLPPLATDARYVAQ